MTTLHSAVCVLGCLKDWNFGVNNVLISYLPLSLYTRPSRKNPLSLHSSPVKRKSRLLPVCCIFQQIFFKGPSPTESLWASLCLVGTSYFFSSCFSQRRILCLSDMDCVVLWEQDTRTYPPAFPVVYLQWDQKRMSTGSWLHCAIYCTFVGLSYLASTLFFICRCKCL